MSDRLVGGGGAVLFDRLAAQHGERVPVAAGIADQPTDLNRRGADREPNGCPKRNPAEAARKPVMTSSIIITACAVIVLLTSGCATTAGAGKDIQSAGKAITKSSEDARK